MPSSPGRNTPCPCGSGKKYKRCCLAREEPCKTIPTRVRRAHARLVDAVGEWVTREFEHDLITRAKAQFFCWIDDDVVPELADDGSAFLSWFLYDRWPDELIERTRPEEREKPTSGLDRRRLPERPPALEWLDEVERGRIQAECIGSFERELIRTAVEQPFGLYTVEKLEAGRAIELHCLMTDRRVRVMEHTSSRTVKPSGIVFARVVAVEDVHTLLGCAKWQLPPDCATDLVKLRHQIAGPGGFLSEEELFEYRHDLRSAFVDLARDVLSPPSWTMANVDDEEIAPASLHFRLTCSPDEAFEKLRSLDFDLWGVGDDELDPETTRRAPDGRIEAVDLAWRVAGNRMFTMYDETPCETCKEMNETVRATLSIDRNQLNAEVDSRERAERICKEIESRLGDAVRFERMVHTAFGELMESVPLEGV